jgi:hypothetical protein
MISHKERRELLDAVEDVAREIDDAVDFLSVRRRPGPIIERLNTISERLESLANLIPSTKRKT